MASERDGQAKRGGGERKKTASIISQSSGNDSPRTPGFIITARVPRKSPKNKNKNTWLIIKPSVDPTGADKPDCSTGLRACRDAKLNPTSRRRTRFFLANEERADCKPLGGKQFVRLIDFPSSLGETIDFAFRRTFCRLSPPPPIDAIDVPSSVAAARLGLISRRFTRNTRQRPFS